MYQITHCWKIPYFKDLAGIVNKEIDRRVIVEALYHIKIFVGDYILFNDHLLCQVTGLREYPDFETMLNHEDHTKIDPDNSSDELLCILRSTHDEYQEKSGVIVVQFSV